MYKIIIILFITFMFSGCVLSKKNNNCDAYSYKEKIINDNHSIINGDSVRINKCCK